MLKSTDAGLTWQALPLSGSGWSFQYTAVSGLQVDPANPNVLYVTTAIINSTVDHFTAPNNGRPQAGIFKSTDGGQTWVRQLAARTYGGSEGGFMDLEMGNASILYATEMSGGIYRTTDGGANWSRITPWKSDTVGGALPAPVPSFSHYSAANGRFTTYNRLPFNNTTADFGRIEIGISSSNPNVIYAGYDLGNKMALDINGNGTFDQGTDVIASVGLLFKSTDGGAGWSWLGDWPRNGVPQYCSDQCAYDNTVVVNPNNADDLVIGGTANYNNFWPDPIDDPQRILAMPWRGMIYRTLDGGRSWTDTTPHCATTNYSAAGQTYGTPPLPAFQCPDNAMDPARVIHPDIHNAAYEPGTGRIYIAHDGGLSRGRLVQGGNPSSSLDYRWDNLNTGLAVVNPTQQAAQLSFSAHSNSGALLASGGLTNPRPLTLAPRSQTAQIGFQLFGLSLDTTSAWVKVSSNISGLAGFFLALDPAPNTMDGVDVSDSLSQSFLFAEPRNAEISLVNPNESQSASATLRFVNNQGDAGAPQVVSIPPNGRYSGTPAGLFSSSLVDAGGYVTVSSSIGLAGTELFGVPNSYLAALNPIETAGGARLLYSPQYAVGGGIWKTTLTLINLESSATSVTLSLVGDNGAPIGRTAALNLPPRGRAVISDPGVLGVSSGAEVIQGYVRVTSDTTRVAGYVRFGDPGDAQFQTALPFVTRSRNELIYSQVAQNETYFTGVAIINTDAAPATVTVTVFNSDGQQVGSGKQTIPSNARISKLLPEIIPTLPALSGGYFRVSSDRPVFSFAVFGTNTLSVLAAVPAQAVTP